MNKNTIDYLESLNNMVDVKDCKVTISDIRAIENEFKANGVTFSEEISDFYIKYNEVIKYNISFKKIPHFKKSRCKFPRIDIHPLVSKLGYSSVEKSLKSLIYDGRNLFLDSLIPLGRDEGGAIVCYKIDDGSIIMYTSDLENKNDYQVVT